MFLAGKLNKIAIINSLFLAAAMFSASVQLAQAQSTGNQIQSGQYLQTQGQASMQAPRPLKRFNGSQNSMYYTERLTAPVSAHGLPEYRGKGAKFESGLNYPKLKTGSCVLMRYFCKDRQDEIMRSYRESLQQQGWQINDSQTNSKQLTASKRKEGIYLTLCVFPSSKQGFQSSFEIKYLMTGALQTSDR